MASNAHGFDGLRPSDVGLQLGYMEGESPDIASPQAAKCSAPGGRGSECTVTITRQCTAKTKLNAGLISGAVLRDSHST